MTNQHQIFSADRVDRDLHTIIQASDRVLNTAIVQAEIGESLEEYLKIFDAFYADDIEVSIENVDEPIRGKARVRALLFNFLAPLHVGAEIGRMSVSLRQTAIPGDAAVQTHSAWTLDLTGESGATCTLTWCTLRKWNGSRVVSERHYDYQQIGGPLTMDDLTIGKNKT